MQIERNHFDLTHFVHSCGKIGRLQTISCVPVIAGDSFEFNLDGIIRLAPLRKEVVSEAQVDLMAFYVPYRHIYGQDWVDFLLRGKDENVTFTGVSLAADERDTSFLALQEAPASIPEWTIGSYNQIWNRYFRRPDGSEVATLNFPTGTSLASKELRKYGRLCARLPHPTNGYTRINDALGPNDHRDLTSSDWEVASSSVLDIRALEQVKARYRSEIERAWFAERYNDVMDIWRSEVNIDADQRPEMVFRQTMMLSGMDVDGTDDATLGSYIGKTVARINLNIPRKWFPEHGSFWVMALVRFPMVHVHEWHYLQSEVNPSYTAWAADPAVVSAEPPKRFAPEFYVSPASSSGSIIDTDVVEPYGQWYRRHPNNIHQHFANIPGYPFSKFDFFNPESGAYYTVGEYDDVFQTSQLGHWQIHSRNDLQAYRYFPEAARSIFAGA